MIKFEASLLELELAEGLLETLMDILSLNIPYHRLRALNNDTMLLKWILFLKSTPALAFRPEGPSSS